MCRSLPWRWSVPLLLLLASGCASSSSLQLLQEPPPYLTELRSEYFTANPDSPYRNDVTVGTVVPGMGRFDVLASWGHPALRVNDGLGREEWTYFDVDAESGDAIEYRLDFKHGSVDSWSARTHKNTSVAYKGHKDDTVEKVIPPAAATPEQPATVSPAGKKVPKS